MSDAADIALYGYFRSSAAWRIALNLRSIKAELNPVHLLKDQHLSENRPDAE
jgi:hypothetical protein